MVMAHLLHPRIIAGILTILLGVVAIGFRANRANNVGYVLTIVTLILFVVRWIWGIIEVATTNTLQGSQRKFWLIAVIAVPFIGGMLYHMLHSRRNTIVD